MKRIKILQGLIVAVMMVVAMAVQSVAANPYGAVSPEINATGLNLKEKLDVTQPGGTNPEVTYTLTLGNLTTHGIYGDPNSVVGVDAVNGKALASVYYPAGTVSYGSPIEKDYDVPSEIVTAINALTFNQPGIYYWPITKASSSNDAALTNHNRAAISRYGTALVVRVDDVSGELKPSVSIQVLESDGSIGNKNAEYEDDYAAAPGTLTLKKEVTGSQGQKDRYFKFTVTLSGLDAFKGSKISPDGANTVKSATAKYSEAITGADNEAKVTITESGTATFTFWLSNQEEITIMDIPGVASGSTQYVVAEEAVDGYTTTYDVEYQGDVDNGEGGTKPGTISMEGKGTTTTQKVLVNDRVVFENDRQTSTPTGVIMQKAAPFAGIALVIVLGCVMMIGRRRRDEVE